MLNPNDIDAPESAPYSRSSEFREWIQEGGDYPLSRSASAIPQADESSAQKQKRCRLWHCRHLEIWAEHARLHQTIHAWLGKRIGRGRTRRRERDFRNRREPRRTSNYLI